MGSEKQKYMNPITLEAELFVHNLESLSQTHKHIDAVLVTSLEKVMNAIDHFLESNTEEIVPTESIQLVKCKNISSINRIYHCVHCKKDLGKSVEKATLHLIAQCNEDKSGQKIASRKVTRPQCKKQESIKMLNKKTLSLLTIDLNKFFEENVKIALKLKCLPEYNDIEKDLKDAILPAFQNKNIKIYKFGSRLAGIGSRESDLDLYVDIDGTFYEFQNRADDETRSKLKTAADALKKHKKWKLLTQVINARVPIVKVLHVRTSIECDINFSNSLGTINTKFLDYIFDLQPIARLLCIFIKKWLIRTKLNDVINTYSVVLMILCYLQIEGVIPSMKRLQENLSQEMELTIGPWLYIYATLTLKDHNIKLEPLGQSNICKFIKGFFTFYTNKVAFKNQIICPYLGKVINKSDVNNLMPHRYTEYVEGNPKFALALDTPIVVQDPFQLNSNTTKGLSADMLKSVILLMNRSFEVLNEVFPSNKKKC